MPQQAYFYLTIDLGTPDSTLGCSLHVSDIMLVDGTTLQSSSH